MFYGGRSQVDIMLTLRLELSIVSEWMNKQVDIEHVQSEIYVSLYPT